MSLLTTEDFPEIRTTFSSSVDKATLLSYLHDVPFMVSLSPIARLDGRTAQPSDWIREEAQSARAGIADASEPEIWTMKESLVSWLPEFSYYSAFVTYPEGSSVVVEAPSMVKLWIRYSLERSEAGEWTLVEHGRMRALKFLIGHAKKTYMSAHEESSAKMKEKVDKGER